jgi:hypothetical protein
MQNLWERPAGMKAGLETGHSIRTIPSRYKLPYQPPVMSLGSQKYPRPMAGHLPGRSVKSIRAVKSGIASDYW